MSKFEEINELIPFYDCLLTQKQRNILHSYYYEDESLSEIADNLSITKSAIYDALTKSELLLKEYESKLHLLESYKTRLNLYQQMSKENLDEIKKQLIAMEE